MACRHPNPRLAKIHRTYSVEEVARLLGVHKNTVRAWLQDGLASIDRRRPTLILGQELVRFLSVRRQKARQKCQPGEIYCVKCRVPRAPAGNITDYLPLTSTTGNLQGLCSTCGILIYRRVNRTKLDAVRGPLSVAFPLELSRIGERTEPSVNRDSNRGE